MKYLYILSWLPFIILKFLAFLLGLLVVPIAIKLDWPRLFWLWNNDEEGCPDWWFPIAERKGIKFPRFWWFAIRNPVNNFRYIFKDVVDPTVETNAPLGLEPHQLKDQNLTSGYKWAYKGWKAGYRKVWIKSENTYSEFWIGWKVGSSVPGLGFTLQVRRNRKIGT